MTTTYTTPYPKMYIGDCATVLYNTETGMSTFTQNSTHSIINVLTPTEDENVANKLYVDTKIINAQTATTTLDARVNFLFQVFFRTIPADIDTLIVATNSITPIETTTVIE